MKPFFFTFVVTLRPCGVEHCWNLGIPTYVHYNWHAHVLDLLHQPHLLFSFTCTTNTIRCAVFMYCSHTLSRLTLDSTLETFWCISLSAALLVFYTNSCTYILMPLSTVVLLVLLHTYMYMYTMYCTPFYSVLPLTYSSCTGAMSRPFPFFCPHNHVPCSLTFLLTSLCSTYPLTIG